MVMFKPEAVVEPASYASAADRVRHLVRVGDHNRDHSDGGGVDDVDDVDDGGDGDNVHLTFSCFSLPLDDGPARRQPSSLAVSPDHFLHHIPIFPILGSSP